MSQAGEQLDSTYHDVSRISELWPRIVQFLTYSSLSQTFCPLSSRCFWWRPESICHSNEAMSIESLNVKVALVGGRPWSELIWYCHSDPFGWGWRRPRTLQTLQHWRLMISSKSSVQLSFLMELLPQLLQNGCARWSSTWFRWIADSDTSISQSRSAAKDKNTTGLLTGSMTETKRCLSTYIYRLFRMF